MIRVIDSLYNDIEPKYWIKEYQHVQRIFNSVTLLFEPFETTTKIKPMVISKILELK